MNPRTISEQPAEQNQLTFMCGSRRLPKCATHQESTERQYALRKERLWNWLERNVRSASDRDLGVMVPIDGRADFKTLVRMFRWAQVGAVFAWKLHDWRARMSIGTRPGVVCAAPDTGDRRGWLIRSADFTMVIVGNQGNDGAKRSCNSTRAPPGR